ncbi:MAG TPA: SDR family oxidoreductase [Acidimicrobiales bacterium]|nr:SDR family oxidoreductase [Acidimicrobiales bacterium]
MSLENKVIVVVGGGNGIGRATVRAATKLGAKVAIADVDDTLGNEVAKETGATFFHLDIRSRQEWEDVLGKVAAEFGGIDTVHISAAVLTRPANVPVFDDPLPWLTEENWRRSCGINVDGPIFGTMAAIPHLEARGGGQILIGMSGAGYGGWALDPYYSMTKAAVNSWMQAMAENLKAKNIRVNTVDPGAPTDGGMPSIDYREMNLPLQDPQDVGDGIAGVMQDTESTGTNFVQNGPGPMRNQAELNAERAAAAAAGEAGGNSIMTEEAQKKLSGRG